MGFQHDLGGIGASVKIETDTHCFEVVFSEEEKRELLKNWRLFDSATEEVTWYL